jgi:hypothetical protein
MARREQVLFTLSTKLSTPVEKLSIAAVEHQSNAQVTVSRASEMPFQPLVTGGERYKCCGKCQ